MTDTYLYQHPPMAPNPFYGKLGDMHGTPFIRESVQRKPYLREPSFRLLRRPNKAAVKVRRRLRMAMRMFDFARFVLWLNAGARDLEGVFAWAGADIAARHWGARLQALRARM